MFLKINVRCVLQATAETAFDMLTPGPTLQLQAAYDSRRRRRRRDPSRHPSDIREGVATAYQTVREVSLANPQRTIHTYHSRFIPEGVFSIFIAIPQYN
jgi:hypothetical protein